MGVASAIAAGVLSWPLIRDALAHPIPITLAVFASGLVFKWTRRHLGQGLVQLRLGIPMRGLHQPPAEMANRKGTTLNSSPSQISYAVFCLKKKEHNNTHS